MPNHSSKPKRPRDANQLAKAVVDLATAESKPAPEPDIPAEADPTPDPIREAAKELGRRGGLKGGPARAKKLTAEERSGIGRKAAKARWDSKS
jgi:hypothetical protein